MPLIPYIVAQRVETDSTPLHEGSSLPEVVSHVVVALLGKGSLRDTKSESLRTTGSDNLSVFDVLTEVNMFFVDRCAHAELEV